MRALDHLRGLLAPEGQMMVTAALGYNPSVNTFLDETPGGLVEDTVFVELARSG